MALVLAGRGLTGRISGRTKNNPEGAGHHTARALGDQAHWPDQQQTAVRVSWVISGKARPTGLLRAGVLAAGWTVEKIRAASAAGSDAEHAPDPATQEKRWRSAIKQATADP